VDRNETGGIVAREWRNDGLVMPLLVGHYGRTTTAYDEREWGIGSVAVPKWQRHCFGTVFVESRVTLANKAGGETIKSKHLNS